jgi:hypothetical protein
MLDAQTTVKLMELVGSESFGAQKLAKTRSFRTLIVAELVVSLTGVSQTNFGNELTQTTSTVSVALLRKNMPT